MHRRNSQSGRVTGLLMLGLLLVGCGSDTTDPTDQTGSLTVTTATTGTDPDDAYTVLVDGTSRGVIGASASVTVSGLTPGSHTVVLDGINANCTVTGGTSTSVTVTAGAAATATFAVACAPNVGTLVVTVLTTGVELDANGYGVSAGGATPTAAGINDTVTLGGVPAGETTVTLSDLAVTCDPSAGVRSATGTVGAAATVAFGETTSLAFTIVCTSKDIVYAYSDDGLTFSLARMNPDGSGKITLSGTASSRIVHGPRWSPDGSRIVYIEGVIGESVGPRIYLIDADGSNKVGPVGTSLSTNPVDGFGATWSPDGQLIVGLDAYVGDFAGPDTARSGTYRMQTDGSGAVRLGPWGTADIAADGRFLSWDEAGVVIRDAAGSNPTLLALGAGYSEDSTHTDLVWMQDGTTILYVHFNQQAQTTTLRTIPAAGGATTLLTGTETQQMGPRLNADGTRLVSYYQNATTYGICVLTIGSGSCTHILERAFGQGYSAGDPDWR